MTVAQVFFLTFFYLICHHILLVVSIAYYGGYGYWLLSIIRLLVVWLFQFVRTNTTRSLLFIFLLLRETISVEYVDPSLHSFSNSTVPNGVHLFYVAQQRTVRIRSKALIIWLMLTVIDGETKGRQLTTRTKLSTSNV